MRAFNRAFAIIVALLWIAACALAIYLMWAPDKNLNIDRTRLQFLLDISVSGSDRVLGTIIAAGAMLPALLLLAMEMRPARRSGPEAVAERERIPGGENRYRELDQRIDELSRRIDERRAPEQRPVAPGEPVAVTEGGYREQPRRRWSILNRDRG